MKHVGECATDILAKEVCEDEYAKKVDQVLELQDALRAVYALAGENPEIAKICLDAIEETGGNR